MRKTIQLLNNGFESASYETPEFKEFSLVFRKEFKALMKKLGCTNLKFSKMHFELSVFFTAPNGKMWYLNTGDVRQPAWGGIFREVDSYTDYRGKTNINFQFDELENKLYREVA